MTTWAALATTATTLNAARKAAAELGIWNKFVTWWKKKHSILVLGASGAGKTQFVNSLLSPISDKFAPMQRTVTVEKRAILIGKSPFIFSDTPGQMLDEAKRKVAITEAIRKKVEGLINVVSFGYHEAAEADKRDALPLSGGHIARADYLETRRSIEEDLLSEWVPFFEGDSAKWILTVVTKADLWWPERERVEKHYSDGDYADALGEFKSQHTVLPYCSRIEPFYGTRTSGKFGESLKMPLREHLLDSLLRLSKVER
jgi:hypothetical protein